jgi:hypothetical protein
MIDSLVEVYAGYCERHTIGRFHDAGFGTIRQLQQAFATMFPESLSEYLQLNDRLYAIWREHCGRSITPDFHGLRTSGSTRQVPRLYQFGPNFQFWRHAVWDLTRFPLGYREIISLYPSQASGQPISVYSKLGRHVILCSPFNEPILKSLIGVLGQFLNDYPACSLNATPDTYLYLNNQAAFRDFAIENRDRFNLMSENWEPFYKQRELKENGVHINNPMMDWSTGLNFYTCFEGHQHVLPLFASGEGRRVNLLNLFPPVEIGFGDEDDLFIPESVSRCDCGLNRLNFQFLPHQATAIRTSHGEVIHDVALAEQLSSNFQGLQFVQRDDTIHVLYRTDGAFQDRELLNDYFSLRGFRLAWEPGKVLHLGSKCTTFYRCPSEGPLPFKQVETS